MDRLARFLCDPKKVIKSLAVLALCVFVLVYVYFQISGGLDSDIETQKSLLVSFNSSIEAESFLFRDETVLSGIGSGTVVTVVSGGERVSRGQLVANVYSDSQDSVLQDEIERISRKIDVLDDSSLTGGFMVSDLEKLDKDIDNIVLNLYSDAARGELSKAVEDASKLLVRLNKRDLIVHSGSDYSSKLSSLLSERAALESTVSSLSSPVYATGSGYFYGEVDGYESIFDIKKVDSVNLDNFDSFSDSEPSSLAENSNSVKIVNSFIWYLVCRIDSSELSHLKEGRHYTLAFPENRDKEIDMELVKLVSETSSPKAVVTFRVNKLPGDFDYKRFQKAQIVKKKTEGLTVPKKSLRIVDGVEGVYVLIGDVVRFRRVNRIAEKDNYYLVEYVKPTGLLEEIDEKDTVDDLSLYDNIIVSGKNLFDGKIIG